MNKIFFKLIETTQEMLIGISIILLIAIPSIMVINPEIISMGTLEILFHLSVLTAFLVMIIRPLADLFPKIIWIRPLVILRKGFGIFSASIIVAFILPKIGTNGLEYFTRYFYTSYWTLSDGALLAHLGDVTAIILLITSNKFSKRILKRWWKIIQKLSYVYFFAGASYHVFINNQIYPIFLMIIIFLFTLFAFIKNRNKKQSYAN